jgi:hypothetical protein
MRGSYSLLAGVKGGHEAPNQNHGSNIELISKTGCNLVLIGEITNNLGYNS